MKLHVGCGTTVLDGYVNVDLHVHHPGVENWDTLNLPLEEDSVDEVLAVHILEHLSFEEGPRALREWRRVLKPGGVLRVEVPDLPWVLEKWLAGDEQYRWNFGLMTIFGNQAHPGEFHQNGFDRKHLTDVLRLSGFTVKDVRGIWSHDQQSLEAVAVK